MTRKSSAIFFFLEIKGSHLGLPWWPVAKTPSSQGLGSIPGQGTKHHVLQLRPNTAKKIKKKKKKVAPLAGALEPSLLDQG